LPESLLDYRVSSQSISNNKALEQALSVNYQKKLLKNEQPFNLNDYNASTAVLKEDKMIYSSLSENFRKRNYIVAFRALLNALTTSKIKIAKVILTRFNHALLYSLLQYTERCLLLFFKAR